MEHQVSADPEFTARYSLDQRLGAGAMGEVWRGQQRALGRPVAIKFMNPSLVTDSEFRSRFDAEARAVAGLIHPHVTAVFDFGIAAGVPYLVTELVEGRSLDTLLAEPGSLTPQECMQIAEQVLSGLEAVHALGILHRDLKPANVMIAARRPIAAKLMDFGIAKRLDVDQGLTRVGALLGSPAYMSPEQASGQTLTIASDLYALTTIIYRMAVGRLPFEADSVLEQLQARVHGEAQVPGELLLPLLTLLRSGLSRSPEQRPADVVAYRALLAEASRCVAQVGSFRSSGQQSSKHRLSTFHGTRAGAGAAVLSPVAPPVPPPSGPGGFRITVAALMVILACGLLLARPGRMATPVARSSATPTAAELAVATAPLAAVPAAAEPGRPRLALPPPERPRTFSPGFRRLMPAAFRRRFAPRPERP